MSSLAKVSWFENVGGERKERSLEANGETLSEKEVKEVRDAIWRFIEDGLPEEVEHLPDDEEEAREQMLQVYLVHEVPYQAGNGYDPRRIRDIDYDCCWALLESELGLTPERNAGNLTRGPSMDNTERGK